VWHRARFLHRNPDKLSRRRKQVFGSAGTGELSWQDYNRVKVSYKLIFRLVASDFISWVQPGLMNAAVQYRIDAWFAMMVSRDRVAAQRFIVAIV